MSLSLIVAISNNNCIGKQNELLWKIPADMKHFKETTTGHPIIMGKKTFESIGRALPNRRNIVITRDVQFAMESVEVFHSVEEVADLFINSEEEAFVIGGGQIYEQFLPLVKKLYVTHVHGDFEGDTFFPHLDPSIWKQTSNTTREVDEFTPHPLDFAIYERI
jgi:dihydrofolate reductase